MRRFMYEISALVANRCNAHVIINGESVGQVASQTLKSMEVINEAIKKPVLRPVFCFDKIEIIDCYDINEIEENVEEITKKYNNILVTAGMKKL